MKVIYLSLGFISLGLGILGIPLPILPTTPFLLLAIACFARSSKRFEKWLYHTKLHQSYVADFRETKSIAKERKKKIIIQIYVLMGISIFFAHILWVKIGLFCLTLFIYLRLFLIKTKLESKNETPLGSLVFSIVINVCFLFFYGLYRQS